MRRSILWFGLAAAALLPVLAVGACSGDNNTSTSASGGGSANGGGGPGGSGTAGAGTGGDLFGDGGGCMPGQSCDLNGEEGVCANDGSCCAADSICGGACCAGPEICSFQQCVVPGVDCIDAGDCAPGEYCEYGLGDGGMGGAGGGGGAGGQGGSGQCQSGVELQTGKCLPKPPECGPNEDPGDPPTCLEKCEYVPPPGQFNPQLKFGWGDPASTTNNVMMAPVVVQLDDDNCDNAIDEKDIPDIVFFTFNNNDYNNNGGSSATLRAISIIDGAVQVKWSTATANDHPGRSIAAGDIHPSPGNEIVVCVKGQRVRAYDSSGNPLWLSQQFANECFMPSIADMDQDGQPEVIVRSAVLDGLTGNIKSPINNGQNVVVYDVTGDGVLDVVGSSQVFSGTGQLIASAAGITGTHPAVGDFDGDGVPEIITVSHPGHTMSVWHVDNNAPGGYAIFRQGLNINGNISPNPCCLANPNSSGCSNGGGPPTVADFNGDGFADVGLAGGIGYVVFDGPSLMNPNVADVDTIAWITPTQDCSSAQTGSSVFDFDGDGSAEVVYADETTLHIYAGANGQELFSTCNTNGTLFEYPLVADVDSDGHADIVVASNSYSGFNCNGSKTTGVRVFGDTQGNWVRTRRVWNQHPYHITNVNEDGTIPAVEAANHLTPGLNNFRLNVQPAGEFSAPDLVVDIFPACGNEYGLIAHVRNLGQASVPPGVVVGFYLGDPNNGGTLLGQGTTATTLYALGSENVFLPLASVPMGQVYAVVDDGMPAHAWHECRPDNNVSAAGDPGCGPN